MTRFNLLKACFRNFQFAKSTASKKPDFADDLFKISLCYSCCLKPYKRMSSSVQPVCPTGDIPALSAFVGQHAKCRNGLYPRSTPDVQRFSVPDDLVSWSVVWNDYAPVEYTNPKLIGAFYADPLIGDPTFIPVWNTVDGKADRRTHIGRPYDVVNGVPRNPMGRTGLTGRGCLGKWGPNHAADPIVTRWKPKRDSSGKTEKRNAEIDSKTSLPILQFIAILRGDCHQWAIPGGMVDAGEQVSATLLREFGEEALNSLQLPAAEKEVLNSSIKKLFEAGELIYTGYVDDPRNTDNAWMETVAVNFHDEEGDSVARMPLQAGDDAVGVQWMDIGQQLNLYASHTKFLEYTAKLRGASW